ncbi:MAG: hypothetical protein GC159_12295 [Phycisphaera sp.]|nr:hypothetical protein [Phycisphaera sp.]
MRHELEFRQDPATMVMRTFDTAEVEGFERLVRALVEHPQWVNGANLLVDHSHLDFTGITHDEIWQIAQIVMRFTGMIGDGRCAIVMTNDLAYGLGRMWESMSEGAITFDTRICTSYEEAEHWIDTGRSR